jgi:glycosyltransferase involved in cell wall biosynthesis
MAFWQLISGEYPPQPGGVSDYSQLVARGLASAGENVQVWASAFRDVRFEDRDIPVHRLSDNFGVKSLRALSRKLNEEGRLLVQYVPHAFGAKATNIAFCLWLFSQRNKLPIDVMFHEVALGFERGQRLRHKMLAETNLLMALFVARAARRVFVAIPAWAETLRPMLPATTPIAWLPVFSNIAVEAKDRDPAARRRRYAAEDVPLLGHFGTYETPVGDLLAKTLPRLLQSNCDSRLLLLGRHGKVFRDRIGGVRPDLLDRIYAPGGMEASELSRLISLCDVMVQPYPDGITSRHTSAMAAFAHGRPVVTTTGRLTEPLWLENEAAALAPVGRTDLLSTMTCELLADESKRHRIATAGERLYKERFDLKHTISALRSC